MKKFLRLITFSVVGILMFVSCIGVQKPVFSTSYIGGYYELSHISSSIRETNIGNEPFIQISLYPATGDIKMLSDLYYCSKHKHDYDNGKFIEYATAHNDINYRKAGHQYPGGLNRCFPVDDFVSIDILCNDDWDNNHPTGSSLKDITQFIAVSIAPFINTGYKFCDYSSKTLSPFFDKVYPFASADYGERDEYPVDKLLKDITINDLHLLGCGDRFNPEINHFCDLFIPVSKHNPESSVTILITDTAGKIFNIKK